MTRPSRPRSGGKKSLYDLFAPFLPRLLEESSGLRSPYLTLWGLLEAVEEESRADRQRGGLSPGLRFVEKVEKDPLGERPPIVVWEVVPGQAEEVASLAPEEATGDATEQEPWATKIWESLKLNHKLKNAALECVQSGTLISWFVDYLDVLAEILRRSFPELGDETAKDVARRGPIVIGRTDIMDKGIPVSKDWFQLILLVLQKARTRVRELASTLPPIKQTRVVGGEEVQEWVTNPAIPTRDPQSDILDELAACMLFGFKLRWCLYGSHWTFGDEHFKYDCKAHQQEKRKAQLRDYLARKTR